jgi:hypothetical protein
MFSVLVPSYLNRKSMYELIGSTMSAWRSNNSRVIFDLKKLYFAEPDGVTIFCNLIEWLKKRGSEVHFSLPAQLSDAIRYLDDCGFFSIYMGRRINPFGRCRATTVPIQRIECPKAHGWIDLEIGPWLAANSGLSKSSLGELLGSILELMHNIRDHSQEQLGCAHVQWYPNERRIRMSISDFGVGIPYEMRRAFPGVDDAEAIEKATVEGVSSKLGTRNRGAGLAYLIDNIVGNNKGWVGIHSGFGRLSCSNKNGTIEKVRSGSTEAYPGTLVSIDVTTIRIPDAGNARESLEW